MTQTPSTIENALAYATTQLAGVSESPRLDAEALIAWILDVPRSYLSAHRDDELTSESRLSFSDAIARRHQGEPVAYITGTKEFWSLDLEVSHDTLVPRPETELLVEQALALIPKNSAFRVLDLGTGSGAIAIAIASERKQCELVATDSNENALAVAGRNAERHSLNNIRFMQGDWTAPIVGQSFDLVVSNPPYVRNTDSALDKLAAEPRSALAAGPDGLDAIRAIARDAKTVIARNGSLLLEHGADQQDAVAMVLKDNGWTDIRCFKDLAGHPRVTTAKMGSPPFRDQT